MQNNRQYMFNTNKKLINNTTHGIMLKLNAKIKTKPNLKNQLKKAKKLKKILNEIDTQIAICDSLKYSASKYSSKKKFSAHDFIPPEQSLWRGVLLQMLEDALNNSEKPEYKHAKAIAKTWLFTENSGFSEVCDLAGVDEASFKKFVLQKIRAKNPCEKL
jgi:hypothetical protein